MTFDAVFAFSYTSLLELDLKSIEDQYETHVSTKQEKAKSEVRFSCSYEDCRRTKSSEAKTGKGPCKALRRE